MAVPNGNHVVRTYPLQWAFAANAATNFNFTTNELVEELQFQLSGTLTNANYTAAPVKRVESIENLLANLQLTGTGKVSGIPADTFCSVDAAYLRYQTQCQETTAPIRTDVGTANATYNFVSTFNRYFGLKRTGAYYPAGFLDTRYLSTFTGIANWRDVTAMIDPTTGTGGTATLSNVQMTVTSIEWNGSTPVPGKVYLKQTQEVKDLTNLSGLNNDFNNRPVGSLMPRQTFKFMAGDTNYADPTDSIFTTTLQAKGAFLRTSQGNQFDWLTISAAQLKSIMKVDYSLETVPVGYFTVEYARVPTLLGDGGPIDLRKVRTLDNYIDLTTIPGVTNTLQITEERIMVIGG